MSTSIVQCSESLVVVQFVDDFFHICISLLRYINSHSRLELLSHIVSISYGIAKYTDLILKKIVRKMPYVATSSKDVVKKLIAKKWDATCTLFTMDASSMYTKIHFEHAKDVIEEFLREHLLGQVIVEQEGININALIFALRIVINYNAFKFGDTFWPQIAGTAMGAPPAPNYATVYFAIWEVTIVPTFPELEFYERYIDDGFGIWKPLFPNNDACLALFKESIQSFGADHPFFLDNPDHQPLQWIFSDLSKHVIFLDLSITLTRNTIATSIYETPQNLYLYIPPHSCHSPGVIKGLIYGCVTRAKALCTNEDDWMPYVQKTFNRLLVRGHSASDLLPTFNLAIEKILVKRTRRETIIAHLRARNKKIPLFFHLPFNPHDPPGHTIQAAFMDTIIHPPSSNHISLLDTIKLHGGAVDFDELVVCYHRQRNLGDILSPRKLRMGDDYSISDVFARHF